MDTKQTEIMNYFNEKIFDPAIAYAKATKNLTILRGVNMTKVRMSKLPAEKMIQYFWSAIVGTQKSIKFSDVMKENGILRFEDIMEDVRKKFNNEYFNN